MTEMDNSEKIAIAWLQEMETCVQEVDYDRCRAIFADDAIGFGTKIAVALGLDALEQDQWRHIWSRIRNFRFDRDQLFVWSGNGQIAFGCAWSSEGRGPDGIWRKRPGRMTAVLEQRGDQWLAVHTHHSVAPDSAGQPRAG